jgi:hypothetical protein
VFARRSLAWRLRRFPFECEFALSFRRRRSLWRRSECFFSLLFKVFLRSGGLCFARVDFGVKRLREFGISVLGGKN